MLLVSLIGTVAIGYLIGLAKVGELERESRRLDRLIANETAHQGALARGRSALCNTAELECFAPAHNMVKAPIKGQQIAVGVLPAADEESAERQMASVSAISSTSAISPIQAGVIAYEF